MIQSFVICSCFIHRDWQKRKWCKSVSVDWAGLSCCTMFSRFIMLKIVPLTLNYKVTKDRQAKRFKYLLYIVRWLRLYQYNNTHEISWYTLVVYVAPCYATHNLYVLRLTVGVTRRTVLGQMCLCMRILLLLGAFSTTCVITPYGNGSGSRTTVCTAHCKHKNKKMCIRLLSNGKPLSCTVSVYQWHLPKLVK